LRLKFVFTLTAKQTFSSPESGNQYSLVPYDRRTRSVSFASCSKHVHVMQNVKLMEKNLKGKLIKADYADLNISGHGLPSCTTSDSVILPQIQTSTNAEKWVPQSKFSVATGGQAACFSTPEYYCQHGETRRFNTDNTRAQATGHVPGLVAFNSQARHQFP